MINALPCWKFPALVAMQLNFHTVQMSEPSPNRLRVGIDLVDVRRIGKSMLRFGPRFVQRLFSESEISYAYGGDGEVVQQRLAARFAAKEAAIKAFNLSEAGVSWRDIEVRKLPGGACCLVLHGKAASCVEQLGVSEIALSLTHEGDYAAAIVTGLISQAPYTSNFSRGTA